MSNEPFGQVDATKVPRYAGLATFARLPSIAQVDGFDVAVVGIPFDSGVSYRPGARFGPSAIRQASRLLRPYNPAADVSPFAEQQVVDAGDLAVNPFDIEAALGDMQQGVAGLATDGRRVVILGGDHTISLAVLRAMHAVHGPVALLHFDAHLDTWDTYFGARFTHGTPFRRAFEEGLIDVGMAFHVGTRNSVYDRTDLSDDGRMGFTIISSDQVGEAGAVAVADRLRETLGDRPAYLSIDIDVLDPAHAPGTGTPEAGGLSSRELLAIVRRLAGMRLVGADVVEVAPAYDHAEVTAVAAANLVYEILCLLPRGPGR